MDSVIFIFVVVLAVVLFFGMRLLRRIMRRGLDEGINVVKRKLNEQNGSTTSNLADRYRQDPPQETTALFCTQCGTKNKAGASFCMNCGAPLSRTKTVKEQSTVQQDQAAQSATRQNRMTQSAGHPGQTAQSAAKPDVNRETKEQKRPSQKKPIPKIAVILPVCVVIIGTIAFVALNLGDDTATDRNVASGGDLANTQTTPFTEYVSLVGGDYKELYSDEYDVVQNGEAGYYYTATTDIPFMNISGTGSFGFFHVEDEDAQSDLEESGIESDTVLGFQWTCDASAYSLDDVSARFESIYGDSPMHGTYSLSSQDTAPQVESYYWENIEGGYDLELYLPSDGTMITASWSVHPAVEGSYEDVVSTLEKAFEDRDVSAYESLLYEDDETLSASDSTKEEMADIISNEEVDQIDCYIGEAIKVNTYVSSYMMSGNYSISASDLERIESLYFVDVDIILYQNGNIFTGATCKIDIAYIDGEWKILGIFQNERFSDTLLVEFAKQYYESVNGDVPPNVEVDHYEGDNVVIHLYETSNNATSTWDWYTINPYTCEGTDFLGNEVRLYEAFGSTGQ